MKLLVFFLLLFKKINIEVCQIPLLDTDLFDMILLIIRRSKRLVKDIISRDYSTLDHQFMGVVSVVDIIVFVVSIIAIRDIIIFSFKVSGSFFRNIVQVVMSYLSIQVLVSTRHIFLRCYATLLFLFEIEAVFALTERIIQTINQFLNRE